MSITRLDFQPRILRPAGWRLAILLAGVLMLCAATAHWLLQLQALRLSSAQWQTHADRMQARQLTRPALAPAQQQQRDLQMQAVALAVRQLNLPVTRLIRSVAAPADIHVALLALDLNGEPAAEHAGAQSAGAMKIAAEAETARDMFNYLAYLNQQSLFRSVYLNRHEMVSAAGERPYHFQLEAQWRQ